MIPQAVKIRVGKSLQTIKTRPKLMQNNKVKSSGQARLTCQIIHMMSLFHINVQMCTLLSLKKTPTNCVVLKLWEKLCFNGQLASDWTHCVKVSNYKGLQYLYYELITAFLLHFALVILVCENMNRVRLKSFTVCVEITLYFSLQARTQLPLQHARLFAFWLFVHYREECSYC